MTDLHTTFEGKQLTRILDQALIYQCACPAQVCRALIGLRELHAYEMNCINRTETDREVHATIGSSAAAAHAELERCLQRILELEGWNMETLTMPAELRELQTKLL